MNELRDRKVAKHLNNLTDVLIKRVEEISTDIHTDV
jgi:hypothetical protein